MDQSMKYEYAGVIFQLVTQTLQEMWHVEMHDLDQYPNVFLFFISMKKRKTWQCYTYSPLLRKKLLECGGRAVDRRAGGQDAVRRPARAVRGHGGACHGLQVLGLCWSATHILAAQGGELWIGALGGRTPFDDPPAMSEGTGGRVTDYRYSGCAGLRHISWLRRGASCGSARWGAGRRTTTRPRCPRARGGVSRTTGTRAVLNKLLPLRGSGANGRARARLQRHTTYWPLTISSTLIFNLGSVIEPLTKLVVQESLNEEEVETCRNVLLSLLGMEVKSSARREEQWRQVWGELEALIRAHSACTAHRALLRVLLECRAHNHSDGKWSEEHWRQVWGELEALIRAHSTCTAHRALLRVLLESTVIRATTDSPLSPTGAGSGSDVWAPRNVLDALLGAPRPSRRPDFAGRMAAGTRVANLTLKLSIRLFTLAGSDLWAPRNVLYALLGAPRPSRRPDFAGRMAAGTRIANLYPQLNQDIEAQH
ncbi:Cell cycle regulator Mat89Bb-like protein [Operophtera brumata]|uniref:Protein asunder n=1 Tax=Operophtera brumata TaxID=104452 RepID=A0A0L7LV97_OPEBR|nr:Cell cycle regulator Mat89Bb-like protein [Operophtera brumata]